MRIARELLDEMVGHARADAPNECCGMIASRNGEAVKVYRAENAAASPLRYEIDGAEQYRIQMEIDDAGLDESAVLKADHHGSHPAIGKIAVLDGLAHLVENLPRWQIYPLKMRSQALVILL